MSTDPQSRVRVIDVSELHDGKEVGDKRKERRTPVDVPADLLPLVDGEPGPAVPVVLINCSLSGLGFRSATEFLRQSEFLLPVDLGDGQSALFHYVVRHCRRADSAAGFLVGAEFQAVSTSTQLAGQREKLLQTLVAGGKIS